MLILRQFFVHKSQAALNLHFFINQSMKAFLKKKSVMEILADQILASDPYRRDTGPYLNPVLH